MVPETQNPLYYRGWSFDSPSKLKENNNLIREYNVWVGIHNELVEQDHAIVEEYNNTTKQTEADKLLAVHEKLSELIGAQEAEIQQIAAEIDSLAQVIR